jgi:repressor LexA
MPPPLTERQGQVLEYVRAHVRRHGRPPSLVEIGSALAIRSTNGVHRLVTALVQKGYLTRTPLQARGIALVDAGASDAVARIPLVAGASSREPASLRTRARRDVTVDPSILGGASASECLILMVADNAMADEGILAGDLIVVARRQPADLTAGGIVGVLYDEVAVARRLEAGAPRLVVSTGGPEPTADLIIPPDPSRLVVGPVRAVLRRLV